MFICATDGNSVANRNVDLRRRGGSAKQIETAQITLLKKISRYQSINNPYKVILIC